MGKTLKYVSEFEFPSDKSGSTKNMKSATSGAMTELEAEAMRRSMSPRNRSIIERGTDTMRRLMSPGSGAMTERERSMLENSGYAKGGKVARLKDTISNERKEMARVEAKRRDAGEEMSRVRSEMRYDKNEMKGMRKQYPVDRREPMIAMAKGGMTMTKPVGSPAPKSDMLYSKKEVNAKNLLPGGKAPSLPHPKGGVNMKHGGMAHSEMAKGGMTPKQQAKVGKVMGEFKAGELHSGSKSGPVVKSRKQAIAIGLSEARKAGKK